MPTTGSSQTSRIRLENFRILLKFAVDSWDFYPTTPFNLEETYFFKSYHICIKEKWYSKPLGYLYNTIGLCRHSERKLTDPPLFKMSKFKYVAIARLAWATYSYLIRRFLAGEQH